MTLGPPGWQTEAVDVPYGQVVAAEKIARDGTFANVIHAECFAREAARAVYHRHALGKYLGGSKKKMDGSERTIVCLATAQILVFGNHLHSPLNMVSHFECPHRPFGIELAGDTRIPSSLLPVHRRGPILYDGRENTSICLHECDRVFLWQFRWRVR